MYVNRERADESMSEYPRLLPTLFSGVQPGANVGSYTFHRVTMMFADRRTSGFVL